MAPSLNRWSRSLWNSKTCLFDPVSQVSQRYKSIACFIAGQQIQTMYLQREARQFMTIGPEHLSKELFRF